MPLLTYIHQENKKIMRGKKTVKQPQQPQQRRRSSRSSVVQQRRDSMDSASASASGASTSTPTKPVSPHSSPIIQRVFNTTSIPAIGALPIQFDQEGDPIPYTTTANSATAGKSTIPIPPSQPLDLNRVRLEAPHEPSRTKHRMFNLPHCPVFYPTEQEWNLNPFEYLESLSDNHKAYDYGICKIVPPPNWRPEFSLDSSRFRFRSRSQKLDTVTASARVKHNYSKQLFRFHDQNGSNLSPNPHVDHRPIDLYKLKVDVASLGGFDMVSWFNHLDSHSFPLSQVEISNQWSLIAKEHGLKKVKPFVQPFRQAYIDYIKPYETFISTFKAKSDKDRQGEIDMSFDDMDNIKYRLNGENSYDEINNSEINNGGDQILQNVDLEQGSALPKRLVMDQSPQTPMIASPSPNKSSTNSKYHPCSNCQRKDNDVKLLECHECEKFFHLSCLIYPLKMKPAVSEWFCDGCLYGSGEYGFDEGEDHCLASFQARDEEFRKFWFETHPPLMKGRVAPNGIEQRLGNRIVSEDDVEKEFWRLVDCPEETVQTEYGADIHTTETGSAFPTLKTNPTSKYATSGWNLENMPGYEGSILSYIKSDVSGMTVPWIYVGMMFSTFCWHNEDHYTYSVNYMHWGETKTWYGVPGKDHEAFEEAMRNSAPDLFKQQPDLLLQLVTLGNPGQLKEAGVPMYVCDQRPNEFVITFPRAFHCGFNHGLNFNEAVNFALPDWIPEGKACVEKYRSLKRNPIFSHDELLITILNKGFEDSTWIYLKDAVLDMLNDEVESRRRFATIGGSVEAVERYVNEDDYQCCNCRAYTYLSQLFDKETKKIYCHKHFDTFVENTQPDNRLMRVRYSDEELDSFAKIVTDHKQQNPEWISSTKELLGSEMKHKLQDLKNHLKGAVGVPQRSPEYAQLKSLIREAELWIFQANNFWLMRQNEPFDMRDTFDGNTSKFNKYETLTALVYSPLRQRIDVDTYFQHLYSLEKIKEELDWVIETCGKYSRTTVIDAHNKPEFERVLQVLEWANVRGMSQCQQMYYIKRTLEWFDAVADLSAVKYAQQVDALLQESVMLQLDSHPQVDLLKVLKASGFTWRSKALKLCSHVAISPEEVQKLLNENEIKDENLEADFERMMVFNGHVRNALDHNVDSLSHDGAFLENAKTELEFVKKYRFKVKNYKNFDMLMKLYETFIRKLSNALRIDLVGFDELKLEKQAQFEIEKVSMIGKDAYRF